LQLVHKDGLAPLEYAPFSTLWTRKRYRVAQRFRQYIRATNCDKLSDRDKLTRRSMPVARCMRIGRSVSFPYSSRTYECFVASVSATYRAMWVSFNAFRIPGRAYPWPHRGSVETALR